MVTVMIEFTKCRQAKLVYHQHQGARWMTNQTPDG